jgi:hypothetical protein
MEVIKGADEYIRYAYFGSSHFICNRERYINGGLGMYKHTPTPFGEIVDVSEEEYEKARKETLEKMWN